jgi:hypothetical protein
MKVRLFSTYHGVTGTAVDTTTECIETILNDIKQENIPKTEIMSMYLTLRDDLNSMTKQIASSGVAKSQFGDLYTKKEFDADLIYVCLYDHLANDKQLAIQPL